MAITMAIVMTIIKLITKLKKQRTLSPRSFGMTNLDVKKLTKKNLKTDNSKQKTEAPQPPKGE
jgi:hypothetical protein